MKCEQQILFEILSEPDLSVEFKTFSGISLKFSESLVEIDIKMAEP